MRYALMALLVLAVLASGQFWRGVAPIGKNENNTLYTWDGMDYEIQQGTVGYASYTTTTAAATDTVKVLYRTAASSHSEIYLRISAAFRTETVAPQIFHHARVLFSPVLQRRAVTAADTVSIRSLTTGALLDNPINRTFTVAAAKNTTMSQIGMLSPYAPLTIGPLRASASANDSIGWGFLVIPNDSLYITWEIITIPRD